MAWYFILLIVLASLALWFLLSSLLYKQFFKRFYDIVLSFIAIVVLSPLLLVLTILEAVKMKGNPFFTQKRPGKKGKDGQEKIFKLIKFRTMTNEKDEKGELLPDDVRLTSFGKKLRSTSIDELPELVNILKGDMSIVGPRPLLVRYLPRYKERQRHRHDVRPGLTGLAQINGRNEISWAKKIETDVQYVENYSLWMDIKIIMQTVLVVLKHDGISIDCPEFTGTEADE